MRPLHIALASFCALVWGFNFVVIQLGLQQISPLMLCFARFFLTSIPAIFFIKRHSLPMGKVVAYGLVMFALQFTLLFSGLYEGIAPGLASLVIQAQVFFSVLLGIFFFSERLNFLQVLGMVLAFAGIFFVGKNVGGSFTLLGFLLVIGAAFAWAIGSTIVKKMGKVNMTGVVIWASLFAWPPLLAAAFLTEGPAHVLSTISNLSWLSIGSIAYIAYLSTLFCFVAWNWLLHEYRLSSVAPFTLLVPISGMAGSMLVFHEPLQEWKIVAALLVIGGLGFHVLGQRLSGKKPGSLDRDSKNR